MNQDQKVFFHKLGDAQKADRLVYERPDEPKWGFGTEVSKDGELLLIYIWRSTEEKNLLFTQDLTKADATPKAIVDTWIGSFGLVAKEGTKLWLQTNFEAEKGRLIQVDLADTDKSNWKEIVPEAASTLLSAKRVGDRLIMSFLEDAQAKVETYSLEGESRGKLKLPGVGSVRGFDGEPGNPETFFSYTSFTTPQAIYRYNVDTGAISLFKEPKVDFDPNEYETTQVFYPSKDGTKIPMFITHKKGIKLDSSHRVLL